AAIFAELQHDARLSFLDDEHAAAEIDGDQHADDDAHADACAAAVVGAAIAAALAAEETRQAAVEVAPHFVEIRRAVTAFAVLRALRIVRTLPVAVAAIAVAVSPAPAP